MARGVLRESQIFLGGFHLIGRIMPPDGPSQITLPRDLNLCRHGKELRRLSAQVSLGRWLVWGHYACADCPTVVLDHFEEMPDEALIAGRLLPIQTVNDALTQHHADDGDAATRQ
jgi:hypothetical protein